MWQSVINYLQSLRTYSDLGPDVNMRRQVNTRLLDRALLPLEDWSQKFPDSFNDEVSQQLLTFVYTQLPKYSGLEIGRTRPSDRLVEDLQLPLVCWFDWPNQLCADFHEIFQVDIVEDFDESLLETIGDLVWFLHQRLQSSDSVPSG